jgi:hypothetical protein
VSVLFGAVIPKYAAPTKETIMAIQFKQQAFNTAKASTVTPGFNRQDRAVPSLIARRDVRKERRFNRAI